MAGNGSNVLRRGVAGFRDRLRRRDRSQDRRILHRVHGQIDGHDTRVGRPVVGPVGEPVRAMIVRGRRVDERAIGIEGQRPVGRAGHQHRRQRIAVDVGIVGQHAGRRRR